MAQREGSRTPHEGTIEFISLDSHKGAGEPGSVSDTSQQSSARAIPVAVLSGAPCSCCFPGIHRHLETSSYLACFLLPLPGCCAGTCQVTW